MALTRNVPTDSSRSGCAILLSGLTVTFSPQDAITPFIAIEDVDLEVSAGEIVCIVGPSGCGKSTILNVIAGLVRSSRSSSISGRMLLETRGAPRNRQIGYMFQQDTLLPWKTALQNVMLPLVLQRQEGAQQRAQDLLDLTGLRGFHHYFPKQLSGGMRKRVQMAQLLAQDPDILLMDEPFGALDAQTRAIMQQEFISFWSKKRRTVLFVTHDLTEAILLGDRIVSMSAQPGRIRRNVPVPIARPRTVETLVGMPEFADLHHMLWNDLQKEASRALSGASASGSEAAP